MIPKDGETEKDNIETFKIKKTSCQNWKKHYSLTDFFPTFVREDLYLNLLQG